MITTKKHAVTICHTLSNTSKMNCKSYGIPAVTACNVGGKLAKIPGSVCHGCYAAKGCYSWQSTKTAQQKRLDAIDNPLWSLAMIAMIGNDKWFRWHDSGDLQSYKHLQKIVLIAKTLPGCQFWLPTKEHALIKKYIRDNGAFPENLAVRVSGSMVDGKPPKVSAGIGTSTVYTDQNKNGFTCKAPTQNGECRQCRACWDVKKFANVAYHKH